MRPAFESLKRGVDGESGVGRTPTERPAAGRGSHEELDITYARCFWKKAMVRSSASLAWSVAFTGNQAEGRTRVRPAGSTKDDILPRAIVPVVKGPLLGGLVNVARRVAVIDQDQVALALLFVVEELAPVAQVLDEFPVAVAVWRKMAAYRAEAESRGRPEQRPSLQRVGRWQAPGGGEDCEPADR